MGSEGVRALSTLTALRALCLVHTGVGNIGVNALRHCVHLRTLNLTRTRVTDAGARLGVLWGAVWVSPILMPVSTARPSHMPPQGFQAAQGRQEG